jgi:site-specific DNA-cytosine methylase
LTTILLPTRYEEIRHYHGFCGLAGGAKGFNRGSARVGNVQARFRCIGGFDVDPAAIRDFGRLAGVPGTVLDLFDRHQYEAWHGSPPPDGWCEATAEDIRRSANYERPHIVFGSAPCKGFSGLLSNERSTSARYQALNQLAIRGLWLMLEAWRDDLPELVLWENVPRIATRGRAVLDQMVGLLRAYGYATAETTHDCGQLGRLAQSRKRFLLVCRLPAKVPLFLYEPPKRGLRGVGEVLSRLPMPDDPVAGPMHRMRPLQWRTWVRLAFVRAGSDWRSLKDLHVADGYLRDFGIEPASYYRGSYGVARWEEPAATITGAAAPTRGTFSVADPRPSTEWAGRGKYLVTPWGEAAGTVIAASATGNGAHAVADPRPPAGYGEFAQLGIVPWDRPMGTVTAQAAVGGGRFAVADPRLSENDARHRNLWRVTPWGASSGTIIGATRPGSGAACVADPRVGDGPRGPHFNNVYRVVRFDEPAGAVTAGSAPSSGGQAVSDPRIHLAQGRGAYGVIPWDASAGAVTSQAGHDNGRFNVADPRVDARYEEWRVETPELPAAEARLVAIIRALDGTWHRPFTTLELAALQSLIDPDDLFTLDGSSDTAWRERIGNAVPPDAAAAIASEMGRTLLLAWAGETFALSSTPIWVRPVAVALSVQGAM